MGMGRVYFAHSRQQYNTQLEQDTLAFLKGYFMECAIFNPGSKENQRNFKRLLAPGLPVKEYMKPFFSIIDECDVVVFISLDGNRIGKGTYEEIMYAFTRKLPVYHVSLPDYFTEITSNQVVKLHEKAGKKSWKEGYAQIWRGCWDD